MNEKVIEAIRAVVDTHTDRLPGLCEWCGETNSHGKDCPVGDFQAYLATLDEPKGETMRVRIPIRVCANKDWAVRHEAHWRGTCNLGPWPFNPLGEELPFDAELAVEADIPLPKPAEPVTVEGTVAEP